MDAQYICPVVTAFHKDGKIDMDVMHTIYDRLIHAGLDGIAIMGSSGEFYGMDLNVAETFARESLEYINGRVPVYIGTGRLTAAETIALSNRVLEYGAYAVMIVGPYYIGVDHAGIETYYDTVLSKINGNVVLYNYPDRTGYDLNPEIVFSLLKKHANIIGYKDTVAAASHTRELIDKVKPHYPAVRIYSGYDENLAHIVLSGGDGCIAALSNLVPETCSQWVKALREGDLVKIAQYQHTINQLMRFYTITTPFMPAMKFAMQRMGIPIEPECVLPAVPPDEEQKQKVIKLMQEVFPV